MKEMNDENNKVDSKVNIVKGETAEESVIISNNDSLNQTTDQVNDELILILKFQPCGESSRSRSRSRERRVTRGTRRRRVVNEVVQVGVDASDEHEVQDVEYEIITPDSVTRKQLRSWRNLPKYKRLTVSETLQQEADLYYSFLKETKHEPVELSGPDDKKCCVCYEYKATRIIVPCCHLCLCYNCAKSIAFYRSTLSLERIPKKCPLCQAAIFKIIAPV